MSVFNQNIQRVFIFDPDNARSTVASLSHTLPSTNGEQESSIFLLAEIRNREHEKNQAYIQNIFRLLQDFFIKRQGRIGESTYEEGLQQVNKYIPELIRGRKPQFLNDVSLITGIVSGNTAHFSQAGEASIMLIHGNRIIDLAEKTKDPLNALKLFRDIATGKLDEDDTLFFSTSNFLDYFSQEKIRRIIEANKKNSIAKGFDEYLMQAPSAAAFAGLAIHVEPGKVKTTADLTPSHLSYDSHGYTSLEELLKREQSTDQILSPKFFPMISRGTKQLYQSIKIGYRKIVLKKPTRVSPVLNVNSNQQTTPQRYIPNRKSKTPLITVLRLKMIRFWQNTIRNNIKKITIGSPTRISAPIDDGALTKQNLFELPQKKSTPLFSRIKESVSFLPKKRKVILLLLAIGILVFSQSMVSLGMNRERTASQTKKSEQQLQAQRLYADISSAFVYGDDNRVLTAIANLEKLQNDLGDSSTSQGLKDEIAESIMDARERLQRITEISLTELIDLSEVLGTNTLSGMTTDGTFLYAAAKDKPSVAKINPATGEATTASLAESPAKLLTTFGTTNLLMDTNGDFWSIGNQATGTRRTDAFTEPNDIVALATYSNRLYVLTPRTNQILRVAQSGLSLSTPSRWITDGSSLADTIDLAIDGAIYVAYKNGAIKKYSQGESDSFTLTQPQNPITSIKNIWTSEKSPYLFVFDGDQRRIILFEKQNGSLAQQFTFTQSIDGFLVDEASQKLYTWSGANIYSNSIPQF